MKSRDFCYWLQGNFELNNSNVLSEEQVQVIRNHLNLVFVHELDPISESETTTPKEILNSTHYGKPKNSILTNPIHTEDVHLIRC